MGVWATSGLTVPGGGFKFENDGDMVSGVMHKVEPLHIDGEGDKPAMDTLAIFLKQKSGDDVEVGLMGIDLRIKFAKADPNLGDWVKIKRVGKSGNKVVYDVETKAAPKAATAAAAPVEDDDEIPF